METQNPTCTCTALVPYIPSVSSFFALIRQRVHEATAQLRKIAPDISLDRLATFIFYGVLGLMGTTAVALGVFGGGAVLVSALASVPYAQMAGFIATTIFRNPALSSAILRVIQTSVCFFLGDVVTALVVKKKENKKSDDELKAKEDEIKEVRKEKEAEKKRSDDKLKAKEDKIKKMHNEKKAEKKRSDDKLKVKEDKIKKLRNKKEAEKKRLEDELKAKADKVKKIRNKKKAEKKRSEDELEAKADEIEKVKEEKETLEVKFNSLKGQINSLQETVNALLARESSLPNAQYPVDPAQVTPGPANSDIIH